MLYTDFKYKFNKGPLVLEQLNNKILEGNCRLAIQLFHYLYFDKFIPPEQILCPYSYKHLGEVVITNRDTEEIDFVSKGIRGDIIFAEIVKNKKGEEVNRTKENFKNEEEWIVSLHSAIYLGFPDIELEKFFDRNFEYDVPLIFHASAVSGGTTIWPIDKFNEYYRSVLLKRIRKPFVR